MDPSGSSKSVIITIGHGRVPTIFWGTDVPGAEVWPTGETSTSLDPDGCLVRRHTAIDTKPLKTRARAKRQIGSEMPCNVLLVQKNAKGWVREMFCLLTGAF